MQYHHQTHEGEDYAVLKKQTGALTVWWDTEKHRPFQVKEFLEGKENGYAACWFPNGQVQFIGRIQAGRMASGMWWGQDGVRQAEFIANCENAVSIARNKDGSLKEVEELKSWMPQEKPQQTNTECLLSDKEKVKESDGAKTNGPTGDADRQALRQ